jgi:hypothetical protein
MKTAFLIFLFAIVSCQSTTHGVLTTGTPLGGIEAENDYSVNINFEDRITKGSASGITVGALLSLLPISLKIITAESPFKDDAVRNALDVAAAAGEKEYDILGHPLFTITKEDFILFSHQTVSVKGYPGSVESITSIPRTNSSTSQASRLAGLPSGFGVISGNAVWIP